MEKRKARRYLKNNFIEVEWSSNGVESNGVAVNLSKWGIDICCLTPPRVGSEIKITFRLEGEKKESVVESVDGKVRWVKRLGLPHSGIEFSSEVNQQTYPGILSLIWQAEAFGE